MPVTGGSHRMDVPFWVWALTVGLILAMLVFDLVGHVRTPQAPTLREAALWSAGYVGIAVVFGLLVLWFAGAEYGGAFFSGYRSVERLSVAKLFILVMVICSFTAPLHLQPKKLLSSVNLPPVRR